MWTDTTADIKCPRGDCAHVKCRPDETPCCSCTCNRKANSLCRTFRYEPKDSMKSRKERTDEDRT